MWLAQLIVRTRVSALYATHSSPPPHSSSCPPLSPWRPRYTSRFAGTGKSGDAILLPNRSRVSISESHCRGWFLDLSLWLKFISVSPPPLPPFVCVCVCVWGGVIYNNVIPLLSWLTEHHLFLQARVNFFVAKFSVITLYLVRSVAI